jgi:uracil-DNA glycosylase
MKPEERDMAALVRWYLDHGVDEAIGDEPVDRFESKEPASVPPPAPSRQDQTAKTPPPAPQAVASAREIAKAATTFVELYTSIESFDGCALKRTATTTCVCDGNPDARIMLIGEAPGAQEDRQGKPFVGPAGQLLDKMLAAIELDRTKVLITNMLFWRPPGNRTPTADEIATCLPFVERMVEIIRPQLLIYIGGSAAKAMLDRSEGITRLRGRWFTYQSASGDSIPATAIFHPAFLLRQPGRKQETWRDLLAIRQRLSTYT